MSETAAMCMATPFPAVLVSSYQLRAAQRYASAASETALLQVITHENLASTESAASACSVALERNHSALIFSINRDLNPNA
jgi:hypothetical protein